MTTARRILIELLVTVPLVGPFTPAHAQGPNLSDIAACNEEAQRKSASPSASPPAPPRPPAAAPTLTPEPGTQTDPSGSFIVKSPDPLLEGMATEGLTNGAYRTAYRDCRGDRLKPKR